MDWSSVLGKFLGIYLLIIAAIWLLRKKAFEHSIRDALASEGIFAISGGMHLIMGLMIVILHPVWTLDWKGLITLVGYLSIAQGIVRLAFPAQSRKAILKSLDKGYWIWIGISGLLGVILAYNGFTH